MKLQVGSVYETDCLRGKLKVWVTKKKVFDYDLQEVVEIKAHVITDVVIPIYNNYHNDLQSGQPEFHWHRDTRFKPKHKKGIRLGIRFEEDEFVEKPIICRCKVLCVNMFEEHATPNALIDIPQKIYIARELRYCVHKGYDLSSCQADGTGCVRCPLHNTFNIVTVQGINYWKNKGVIK